MQSTQRLSRMPEYIFAQLKAKVRQVEQQTKRKVLNLGIGDPDYPPSSVCIGQYQDYLAQEQAHHYPGYGPIPEFNQAVFNWHRQRFELRAVGQDLQVLPLSGAKDGITHLSLACLDPGDEVLVPNPGYPAYRGSALLAGAKPVSFNLTKEDNYQPNLAEIKEKKNSKTKLIWLNYPSNPIGALASGDLLVKLVELAIEHDITLAYDNAYSEIYFKYESANQSQVDKPVSIFQIPGAKKVAIEFHSFSKTFSLAGYRLGWALGNVAVIQALSKVKAQVNSGVSWSLQKLGAYCLNQFNSDWHQHMIKNYQLRRELLAKKLVKLGLKFELPPASLYIWAKIPDQYKNSQDYSLQLLENKQVLLTPGTAFGSQGKRYVRASVCSDLSNLERYL